jgi:hypothetical protein
MATMRSGSVAIGFVFLALGCSGRDGVRDAGDSARGLVRVDLSYTHAAGAPANDVHFDAQARFVRYRAFDSASVPTILGFADFESLPLDGCKVANGTAELDEALAADTVAPTAEVALLDAGRLELHGPPGIGDRAVIGPRHYPELVPFVSGVVYLGDEATPVSLALGQPYQVSGVGGSEVGAFSATVTAPRSFPTLGIATIPFVRGGDLELRWGIDLVPTNEPLLIEVKWTSRVAGSRTVRCRVRDDGAFAVPHDAFAELPPSSAISSATVTATRAARTPLFAPGAGRGELTLALKDVAALQVTP